MKMKTAQIVLLAHVSNNRPVNSESLRAVIEKLAAPIESTFPTKDLLVLLKRTFPGRCAAEPHDGCS